MATQLSILFTLGVIGFMAGPAMTANNSDSQNNQIKYCLIDHVLVKNLAANQQQINIPDIHENNSNGGGINMEQGNVEGMGTLHRTGVPNVEKIGHNSTVQSTLAVKNMAINFEKFKYTSVNGNSINGNISAKVGDNAISVKYNVHKNSAGCTAQLNAFRLNKLVIDSVQIKDNNNNVVNLENQDVNNVINALQNVMRGAVEQQVKPLIKQIIKQNENFICQKISSA